MTAIDATQTGYMPSSHADPTAFVRRAEGLCELDLMVSGASCAACIVRIETGLREDARVETARLNLSTGRLALAWRGEADAARELINKLGAIGYPATPYEPEADSDPQMVEEKRLLRAMAVAGFAMANVMLLSVAVWSGVGEMSAAMERSCTASLP